MAAQTLTGSGGSGADGKNSGMETAMVAGARNIKEDNYLHSQNDSSQRLDDADTDSKT